MVTSRIQVAVGIISDHRGRVLLGQRTVRDHYFEKWEFPGGKFEHGEDAEAALTRELQEEIGIGVLQSRPLISIQHDYRDRQVELHVRKVQAYRGKVQACEAQALQWIEPNKINQFDLLDANQPIINAIRLPEQFWITDIARYGLTATLARIRSNTITPKPLVQIRDKGLQPDQWQQSAHTIIKTCHATNTPVIINNDPELAQQLAADGVHLTSDRLHSFNQRPLSNDYWLSASCHNEQDLTQAEAINADFVLLSPVQATTSHPDIIPLGWHRFSELARSLTMPVYALGGVSDQHIKQAQQQGAQGVAMLSAAWQS